MRLKINEALTDQSSRPTSNLYKRFRTCFDTILNQAATPTGSYVANTALEDQLRDVCDRTHDSLQFFVGATGIGKSTYIRHVFGVTQNPHVSDHVLVIPFHLDGVRTSLTSVDTFIIGKIQAASVVAAHATQVAVTDDALASFIGNHRADLLYRDLVLPLTATLTERLARFKGDEPYAYVAELLKYTVNSSDLTKVLIVLDDIESSPYEVQRKLLEDLLKFQTCLTNIGDLQRTYTVTVLTSCRPLTERLLRAEASISAYPRELTIDIDAPIQIADLFSARFADAIPQAMTTPGGDTGRWKEARATLESICSKVSIRNGETILYLNNFNFRRALQEFVQVLGNSKWFEVDSSSRFGAFSIEERNYRTTDAGVIRALALGSGTMFRADRSSIVNILRNSSDPESDLLFAYIIRYFLGPENTGQARIHVVERRVAARRVAEVLGVKAAVIAELLRAGCREGLLDVDSPKQSGRRSDHLSPLPKMRELWDMLRRNAIYLELCRDDTYVRSEPGATVRPTSALSGTELFVALFDFWDEIADAEERVLHRCNDGNRMRAYLQLFGAGTVSREILRGIGVSVTKYFLREGQPRVPAAVQERRLYAEGRCQKLDELAAG